jgi:hypothetical protein
MTIPAPVPPQSAPPLGSSTGKRILLGGGGVAVLGLGLVVTVGLELVGIATIAAAWWYLRRKGTPLTRTRAWVVSAFGCAVPMMVVFVFGLMSSPTLTPEQQRQALIRSRERTRDSMPEALKKFMPPQPQGSAQTDSVALKLLNNRGFMVWFGAMASVIGSGLVGMFAGTFGWGATMLIYRAVADQWMGTAPPIPLAEIG